MKLKSVFLTAYLSLVAPIFAAPTHLHPEAKASNTQSANKKASFPAYCEVEIINDSFSDLRVFGTFDDGTPLAFNIYRYEPPHYIDLFYFNYCHNGMYLTIETPFNTAYSGWVNVGMSVRIIPSLGKQTKAEVATKH